MIREGAKHWGDDLAKILVANEYDASLTLSQMGEEMIGELKDSIRDMNSPSLSPVTLLLRERFGNNPAAITFKDVMQAREDIASGRVPAVTSTQSKPLIWTGDMISAVGKEVE
jgi:hypothetical protein